MKPTTYPIPTRDNSSITLTRFSGNKAPIMFIHGLGCSHFFYDLDKDHSLARFLNNDDWDVWLLDLRTHDGDGDFQYGIGSDREYINRYWDFDNTFLNIDVATAVDFIKKVTNKEKIYLSGHSSGGYLSYAYAMIRGEQNLSGIITTGSSPYANPDEFQQGFQDSMENFGYHDGEYAYVKPDGKASTHTPCFKMQYIFTAVIWPYLDHTNSTLYYQQTTPYSVQRKTLFHYDSEPAGVFVDMMFGKDPEKYHGYWLDPQTLYNYSANLDKITIPILFIAGDEDPQDPAEDIYQAYENVSSNDKTFHSFPEHSHLDLLLANDCNTLIFPVIQNWLNEHERTPI